MSVKSNQLEVPFTSADKSKLDTVAPNAAAAPAIASQGEAEAGTDNVKMMTPLRVAQAIAALAPSGSSSSAIQGNYLNNSGSTLSAMILVWQDTSGGIDQVIPTFEEDVFSIVGLLTAATLNNAQGNVALSGLLKNVTTAFVLGDILYLSRTGALSTTVPDIGVGSFQAGDWVVKVGKITKNSTNGAQKDLKLEIEVIGQL